MPAIDLFVILGAVASFIYAASMIPALRGLFRYLPPVVWLYFVPMLLTTAGLLPSEHSLYANMAAYVLPFALLLLTVSLDLRAVVSVGKPALIALLIGSFGVALGCILAMLALEAWLPADGWQGLAMLSATWIGGSANMVAIQQSLGASAELLGPVVVVDTLLGYGWLSLLILLSAWQGALDRFFKADDALLDEVTQALSAPQSERSELDVAAIIIIGGAALLAAWAARKAGEALPPLGDPTIISPATWTIVIVVTLGLFASGTRIGSVSRRYGTSSFAYAALFMLLTTIGAQADLRALTDAPIFMAAGLIVLATHVAVMVLAAKLLRLPSFIVASASMANIGGAVSAPIASAAYRPALAPVGALLGVAGYIIGIYIPLAVAKVLAAIAL